MARFDASDQFVGSELLASGMNGPVDFAIEPATGWLYVACIIDDHVRRIRWAPVAGIEPAAPRLALSPPSPNPMHGGTAFTLTLPGVSRVAFDVLDASGRRIRHAPETTCEAGSLRLSWDGLDSRGARVPPGLYFARVTAAGETLTRRVIALR